MVKVKDNNSRRALRLNEISESAADCLYWWNKGMSKHIYDYLLPFAQDAFDTGIFNIIGDDPSYTEQAIRNRLDDVSKLWSDVLCNPLDRYASAIGRRLANLLDTWTSNTDAVRSRDFWRGYLGQLVFYRDGFPMRDMRLEECVAILRSVTHRVHKFIDDGRLTRYAIPGDENHILLDRGEVVRLWEERTGLQVGNAKLLRFR